MCIATFCECYFSYVFLFLFFFFQAEDGIRDIGVTGVQTCALPICSRCEFDSTRGDQPCRDTYGRGIRRKIGRGSCRGRGVSSGGGGSFTKKKKRKGG